MPELKTKHVTAPILKQSDFPEDVVKAAEGVDADIWFYATVEAEDREGDIVRVKGIDTTAFAANGPIKFIMNHSSKPLADGRLPVLGKTVKWVSTKHKSLNVPALAVGVKFADTELAKETKTLYEGGFLSDVSIGFQPTKAVPIPGAGMDYQECAVGELSACVTGMNAFAGVLRALEDDKPAEPIKLSDEDIDKIKTFTNSILTDLFKTLNKRMDDFEDSLSALPNRDGEKSDRKDRQSDKIDLNELRNLLARS